MESAERRRRIAIAEASDKLWNGEISRSAFLHVCARAGIGLAGLATLLLLLVLRTPRHTFWALLAVLLLSLPLLMLIRGH